MKHPTTWLTNGLANGLAVIAAMTTFGIAAHAADEESITATAAGASTVDTRGGDARIVGTAAIAYSPFWSCTNSGAYAVIEKIEHAGMFNETNSILSTCAADTEGALSFAPASGDPQCVRLVHRTYDSGGTQVGATLVRDVSFGCVSEPGTASKVDCREESLLEAVSTSSRKSSPVMLTYSTRWATNGVPADVMVKAVRLANEGGTATGTNLLFAAAATAEGATPLRGISPGWLRLVCRVADANDSTLLEYVTGDFLLKPLATTLFVR